MYWRNSHNHIQIRITNAGGMVTIYSTAIRITLLYHEYYLSLKTISFFASLLKFLISVHEKLKYIDEISMTIYSNIYITYMHAYLHKLIYIHSCIFTCVANENGISTLIIKRESVIQFKYCIGEETINTKGAKFTRVLAWQGAD